MKSLILTIALLPYLFFAWLQTNLPAPISVTSPANQSPTWTMDITPESSTALCPTLAAKKPDKAGMWRLCGVDGTVKIDIGSGYVAIPMKQVTVNCPKGTGSIAGGFISHGCTIK